MPGKPCIFLAMLLCLGYGYTAGYLAEIAMREGWRVAGCHRSISSFRDQGGVDNPYLFTWTADQPLPPEFLAQTTHLLLSIPPGEEGDPVFLHHAKTIAAMPKLNWLGYLSATSVYGDSGGGWVDESTLPSPQEPRGRNRLRAEKQWLSLEKEEGLPVHIFRISGIYGPGRNAIRDLLDSKARCIFKPGHYFSRIHVEDIAGALWHSIHNPAPGEIYNLADHLPAPSHEVVEYAADLLGIQPPPRQDFMAAKESLSPMLQSFYAANRRVSSIKLRERLGYHLRYPDYRRGLEALLPIDKSAQNLL